jgi:glycine/D-amino acid oxidase-like deaminating enzyme
MMTYDWIVIGNGLAGAALSYELTQQGASVLVLETDAVLANATRYSYGGIAYWSATTEILRELCQDSIQRYPQLADELGADVEFRELDLILTIDPTADPSAIAETYALCMVPPRLISTQEACDLEPQLNPGAIAAALTVRHGHVHPMRLVSAYNHAFRRNHGVQMTAPVTGFVQQGDRILGVYTPDATYHATNTVVCAGGLSRNLLKQLGITVPCYFTHAEMLAIPPSDLRLRSLVMPANLQRFRMEAQATTPEVAPLWDEPGREVQPAILDSGVVQFQDGTTYIGQISRTLTDVYATVNADDSERQLRRAIAPLIPAFTDVPAQWHHCLVAFSGDRLPLIGALPGYEGLHLFSGFGNPFAILPPLAQRFASHVTGKTDSIIPKLSPLRFR